MFKRLSLSGKLYGGFGIVLALLSVLGVLVYQNLGQIRAESEDYVYFAKQDRFAVEKEVDHLKWVRGLEGMFLRNQETAEIQLDHTKCGLGKFLYGDAARELADADAESRRLIEEIKGPHQALHASAREVLGAWRKGHPGLLDLIHLRLEDHLRWASRVADSIIKRQVDGGVQMDPTRCAFGRFLASDRYAGYAQGFPRFREIMEKSRGPHERLHASAQGVMSAIAAGRFDEAAALYEGETLSALKEISALFNQAVEAEQEVQQAQAKAEKAFQTGTLPALAATQKILFDLGNRVGEVGEAAQATLESRVASASWLLGVLSVAAVFLGVAISIFLARSITRPINRVIEGLTMGSDQVSAASGQVAQSSQQMAEGASEQASSLEEISASLEQMASMTKQNAQSAQQANKMSADARDAAERGGESMGRMSEAIGRIKGSSDETAKIVKTIDEIAFQTNLLALNAAVEAARAGEAGKGFAVVAEEVRNLAQRSAEAAKNTAELIEESLANAENGVKVSAEVETVLQEIAGGVSKVTQFIGEVSAASNEQAQGIEQVNTAVSQMDRVTQSNAANAEESASASEQLSAQARDLKDMVHGLVAVVGGSKDGAGSARGVSRHPASTARSAGKDCWEVKNCGRIPGGEKASDLGVCPAYPDHGKKCWAVAGTLCGGKVQGSVASKLGSCFQCDFYKDLHGSHQASTTKSSPQQLIPLDEEELRDF